MTDDHLTGSRDYVAEMATYIEELTRDGFYSTTDVARRITKTLQDEDPDLLEGWLRIRAEEFVRETILRRDRAIRAHLRVVQPRTAFRQAVEAAESGDNSGLVNWLASTWAVRGQIKTLGDMSAEDLRIASGKHRLRARENALSAAFLSALAIRVGEGLVSDYLDNEELNRMWHSINNP